MVTRILPRTPGQRDPDTRRRRRGGGGAKAQIDNKPPRTFLHNHVQVKKIQLQQDRLAYIEKDNKLMLERIAQIMRSKGLVDNWNDCYLRRSRNCGKRNRDIVRITMDNQALLKRIQETKPDYEYKKWEKEWQASRNHLKLKIIYPDATKTYPDATKQY
ncbi:sperm axonemal maintenance protein CFAP97D1 isoform X2 [Ascaphus truei]|uniref:sperm axonemal maintenance protein CFAP97D1 isoform X2 n=1 Tax=Ascaphus truei TaxID=8439 RepID=UPI003F5960C6